MIITHVYDSMLISTRAALEVVVDLIGIKAVNACIDTVRRVIIEDIITKESLDENDIHFLKQNFRDSEYEKESELVSVVIQMAAKARERSHGAATLYKVYINNSDYDNLTDNGRIKCTIGKVRVLPCRFLDSHEVIGICSPKFENMAPELLVIFGDINVSN